MASTSYQHKIPSVVQFVHDDALTPDHRHYLNKLYLKEYNEDEPNAFDPATADTSIRLQICEDIGKSKFFLVHGREPANMEDVYAELKQPKYLHIFQQVYGSTEFASDIPNEYTNTYRPRDILFTTGIEYFTHRPYINSISALRKEYVFTCLLKEKKTNEIISFYVSKAYDVKAGLHVHRFVFLETGKFNDVLLAEQSAEIYLRPYFNIELHYLALRRHHEPATNNHLDPVVRLNTEDPENNQIFRLCTIIFSSPYFEKRIITYDARKFSTVWEMNEISFRTDDGMTNRGEKSYHERMVSCYARKIGAEELSQTFYISRAYNPNQVFVFIRDPNNSSFYLEYLATNVNIVHELYNF